MVGTQHDPDEFWQGPEVAHRIVYGYGLLTWEWVHRLRGHAHVLPFAVLYQLLRQCALDRPPIVALAPRLLQSAFAAVGDVSLWSAAEQHLGRGAGSGALTCSLTSWFVWYIGVRTYSSCLEAVLLTMAFALMPLSLVQRLVHNATHVASSRVAPDGKSDLARSGLASVCAALAVAVRPTALLLLLPLCGGLAMAMGEATLRSARETPVIWRKRLGELCPLMTAAAASFTAVTLATHCIDRLYYGDWVMPAVSFFRFNLLCGGAAYYGEHPWHWYLTCALPAALGTHAPLVLRGFRSARGWQRAPAIAVLVAVAALSLSSHKEIRFLYPLAHPLLMAYGGITMRSMAPHRRLWCIVALVSTNLPAALYLSVHHQRAPMDLMATLRAEQAAARLSHVDMLTRCHQTPPLSQLHANVTFSYLHCPPPALSCLAKFTPPLPSPLVRCSGRHGTGPEQRSEAEARGLPWVPPPSGLRRAFPHAPSECVNECECFFAAPAEAVARRYDRRWWQDRRSLVGRTGRPSHVVITDEMFEIPAVATALHRRGYVLERRFFDRFEFAGGGEEHGRLLFPWLPWPIRSRQLLLLVHRLST
jgi:phosphatidylinositol glycan class B